VCISLHVKALIIGINPLVLSHERVTYHEDTWENAYAVSFGPRGVPETYTRHRGNALCPVSMFPVAGRSLALLQPLRGSSADVGEIPVFPERRPISSPLPAQKVTVDFFFPLWVFYRPQ